MKWNDLSMKERSDLMSLFLKHGIGSLSDMRHIYDGEQDIYSGGTLNSSKVSASLTRDQWNNLYRQGKASLAEIPRQYQSYIQGDPYNSGMYKKITDATDKWGEAISPILIELGTLGLGSAANPILQSLRGGYKTLNGTKYSKREIKKLIKEAVKDFNKNIDKTTLRPSFYHVYSPLSEALGNTWVRDSHLYDRLTGRDVSNISTVTGDFSGVKSPTKVGNISSNPGFHYKGKSETLYNYLLNKNEEGLISGESLIHPEITEHVWTKFPYRVIGNNGARHEGRIGRIVNLGKANNYIEEIPADNYLFDKNLINNNYLWDSRMSADIYPYSYGGLLHKYPDGGELKPATITERVGRKWDNFWWQKVRKPKDYSDEVADTPDCARWSNAELRKRGYNIWGDAWTRSNNRAKKVVSGYDGLEKPEEYSYSSYKDYVFGAADNVKRNFDWRDLEEGDIVGLYFRGSPNYQKAFLEGANGEAQTHTGHVVYRKGKPYIAHNVHGDIVLNKAKKLMGRKHPYGIVSVYRPY